MGQLTDTGFVIQRLSDIVTTMDAGMKSIYGADINTDPDSPDGQMIGLYSQALADLEELAGEMWRQMDPDYASGPNLDRIVGFSGTQRVTSAPSYLRAVILSGTPNIPIPADAMVTDPGGERWRSLLEVTLDSNGSARVDFQSVDNGDWPVGANVVLTIISGVAGWKTATTSAASVPGVTEEMDPDLRTRFYMSRERTADDDASSMRGNLLAVSGVDDCEVYENYSATADANGVAAHTVNPVVSGGDEQAIGKVILLYKSLGCGLQGNTTVYVIDQFSRSRTIYFDRPTQVEIFVSMQVTRRANFTDIDQAGIANALAATSFGIGQTVIRTELYQVMYTVPGFIVTQLLIGTTAANVAAQDITVGPRDMAVIDAANVAITVV